MFHLPASTLPRDAALEFVDALPADINLGLVTFDGVAVVRVSPTTDRTPVTSGIEDLELGPGTAIGEAIFASLEAVEQAPASDDTDEPVPAHIVVMSDGKTTMGRDNSQAANAAAEAEVPVSTIAFGTAEGAISEPGFEEPTPVPVEPEALAEIAGATGGTAFEAATLDELSAVYEDIGSDVGHETEEQEVTYRVVWAALALLGLAALASLLWSPRFP